MIVRYSKFIISDEQIRRIAHYESDNLKITRKTENCVIISCVLRVSVVELFLGR